MVKQSQKGNPKNDDISSSENESSDNETIDKKQYHKFLSTLFPSEYMKNKIDKEENKDRKKSNSAKKSDTKRGEKSQSGANTSNPSKKKASNKKREESCDIIFTILPEKKRKHEEDEYEDSDDDEDDEEYEMDDESNSSSSSDSETSSSDEESDEDDSDYVEEEDDEEGDSSDSDEEEEEEDEEESSEDEDETESETTEQESEQDNAKPNRKIKESKKICKLSDKKRLVKEDSSIFGEIETFKQEIKKKYKGEKEILKSFKEFENKIQKQKKKIEKRKKLKNIKKYVELVSSKNLVSDIKFFKKSLNPMQQSVILNELEHVSSLTKMDKPYRIQLLENKEIPDRFKAVALKKINLMKALAEAGGEYSKLKNWIDSFMRIPFNKYQYLPVSKSDPPEKLFEFMEKSQQILDDAVYGMKDAKSQFMQMVAQWVANPNSIGNAIAIKGPMGTGKTTLVKYGVSKLLNREFAFIPLGGATDSSYLEGHSYTYEGSTYGKIVDILIQCKTSNPVIFFDELDKVSDTPKGEEIIGILTHLTDTTQNDKFHDKYFSEIDINMSKCLFVFSYNDESKINPILKDRMYNIETNGYDYKDKIVISNKYLIPKLEKEFDVEAGGIKFSDDVLKYIIEHFTGDEKGVRNLKRCLEIMYSKLNLFKFMKPNSELFGEKIVENIQFPYIVQNDVVDKILKRKINNSNGALSMYL